LLEALIANIMAALGYNPGNVGLTKDLLAYCAILILGHLQKFRNYNKIKWD